MTDHRTSGPRPTGHDRAPWSAGCVKRRVTRLTRPVAVVVTVATTSIIAVSCGIGSEDSFEVIPPQDIPFGLDQPATSTTTTTTTVPVEDPTQSTSTTIGVQTEPAEVYFVAGLDRLQRQTLQLSSPVGPFQVIAVLAEEPAGEQSAGLRTVVAPGLVRDVLTDRGVATVDLDREILDTLSPRDQRLVIAQLVLSMIGSVRGIGQVRFTVDEVPAEIGIPPDYTLSAPGEPLAFADFESLLVTSPASAALPSTTTPGEDPEGTPADTPSDSTTDTPADTAVGD